MTVNEVFSAIAVHQVEGMMLHNDMADYYDFLGLKGLKRMHEYHFLNEAIKMRGVHRYFINHYNELLEGSVVSTKSTIPKAWYDFKRQDVEREAKQNAIQSCIGKWLEWEKSTKSMYEGMYKELCDSGEIAAAEKIERLVCDVDHELKCADRLNIEYKSVDYELGYILCMQEPMHEKYMTKISEMKEKKC